MSVHRPRLPKTPDPVVWQVLLALFVVYIGGAVTMLATGLAK